MEPEGSLLCSQNPTSGPSPEPDEFSPHLHTLFLWLANLLSSKDYQVRVFWVVTPHSVMV